MTAHQIDVDVIDALLVRAVQRVEGYHREMIEPDASDVFGTTLEHLAGFEAMDDARLWRVVGPAMQAGMRLAVALANDPFADHRTTASKELRKLSDLIQKDAAEARIDGCKWESVT